MPTPTTGLINQPTTIAQPATDALQTRAPATGAPTVAAQAGAATAPAAGPAAPAPAATAAPAPRPAPPTPAGLPGGVSMPAPSQPAAQPLAPTGLAPSTGATPAMPAQPQAGQAATPATPAQPAMRQAAQPSTGQPAVTGRENAAERNATAAAALAPRPPGTPPNVTGQSLQVMGSIDPKTRQPVDPGFYELKQRLLSTLTPEQLKADMAAFRADQSRDPNESRTFKEWLQARADAYIQGWITPDANDQWRRAGIYTPEQQGLLQEMQAYLQRRQGAQPVAAGTAR